MTTGQLAVLIAMGTKCIIRVQMACAQAILSKGRDRKAWAEAKEADEMADSLFEYACHDRERERARAYEPANKPANKPANETEGRQ